MPAIMNAGTSRRYSVVGGERRVAEEAGREHGRRGACLPGDERGQQARGGDEGADDLGTPPPLLVAVDERPDEGEQAARCEREAGQVERRVGAVALGQE